VPEIKGQIARVLDNGDAVTDILNEQLQHAPQDDRVRIACNGHTTLRLLPEEHAEPPGTLVAVFGGSGFLEISLVGDSASEFLGFKPNMAVQVRW